MDINKINSYAYLLSEHHRDDVWKISECIIYVHDITYFQDGGSNICYTRLENYENLDDFLSSMDSLRRRVRNRSDLSFNYINPIEDFKILKSL